MVKTEPSPCDESTVAPPPDARDRSTRWESSKTRAPENLSSAGKFQDGSTLLQPPERGVNYVLNEGGGLGVKCQRVCLMAAAAETLDGSHGRARHADPAFRSQGSPKTLAVPCQARH